MNVLRPSDMQSRLNRDQKEAVGLLSIGTFLEYFDLMLYVHMAVLLNELFFPKTDPHTAKLLSAFAFCSTYLLRPFGAMIFGWIGDNIGRKSTVIITTMMMGLSCIVIANIGTYAEIGITAAYIVTICRVIQGMSSLGEMIGAQVYLTELVKPPIRYSAVATIVTVSALGSTAALGIASLVISINLNWRLAFWIGALIALVGTVARTSLRETSDFVSAKKKAKANLELNGAHREIHDVENHSQSINLKTVLAYFLMESTAPMYFYIIYIYCAGILNSMGFSSEQVVNHNFFISIVNLLNAIVLTLIVYKVHPIKILEYRFIILAPVVLLFPYLISIVKTQFQLLAVQSIVTFFACGTFPASPVIFNYFPVLKRFTCASVAFAAAKAAMCIVTAFGVVYLTSWLGHYGLSIIMISTNLGYVWALRYFRSLEIGTGSYYQKNQIS